MWYAVVKWLVVRRGLVHRGRRYDNCNPRFGRITIGVDAQLLAHYTTILGYIRPVQMSGADDRKAKAARAKALVRTSFNGLKPSPFLTCRPK